MFNPNPVFVVPTLVTSANNDSVDEISMLEILFDEVFPLVIEKDCIVVSTPLVLTFLNLTVTLAPTGAAKGSSFPFELVTCKKTLEIKTAFLLIRALLPLTLTIDLPPLTVDNFTSFGTTPAATFALVADAELEILENIDPVVLSIINFLVLLVMIKSLLFEQQLSS